jgi:crotonobetainyl-CoA:carnitine CoA-transferase CaiB-like acyl-CoA transferase
VSGPLDGLVVLEAGQGISVAYCTQVMGVMGADVIKVELPEGDETRRLGPFPDDVPDREQSALFLYLNRNKRSVTLDLETASGQELFRALASGANVVVENFPPGYLDERGIGYEALATGHPELVMSSVTPFGQDGPYRDYGASEMTMFALGGLMNLVGDISREPLKFGGSPAYHAAGVNAFTATMIAVELAETAGVGQYVDVAIMEGLAASHFQDLVDYAYHGGVRRRGELRTPIPASDGFISFTVQAHQYNDFRRLILGDEAGGEDEGDAIERDRQRREGEMDMEILTWSLEKTKLEAYRLSQEAHVPAAYLADMKDIVESPQFAARDFFVDIEHPQAGTLSYPGFPAKLTGAEWRFGPAPLLGEHTEEVLRDLAGLSAEEIAELQAAGVA